MSDRSWFDDARPSPWRTVARVALLAGVVMHPATAFAQRAADNAVERAGDAFGARVGTETSGIYTENDVRGFSPQVAGNARLDGVYFDLVGTLALRLVQGSTIRVGFAALDQPFPAPTGIVDYQFRTSGNEQVASLALALQDYGGSSETLDMQTPILRDHISVAAGLGYSINRSVDGASQVGYIASIRPTFRFDGGEISPFYNIYAQRDALTRPIVTTNGAYVPPLPEPEHYFGQRWAENESDNVAYGVTGRAELGPNFSLRGGVVHSGLDRPKRFLERFAVIDPNGLANHILIADPHQETFSETWDVQLAWNQQGGAWRHRVLAGMRGRNRHTESGGFDARNFGQVMLGEYDPEPQPTFNFGPINVGETEQTNAMLGYFGRREGIGQVNLGLQRADYEATFRDALSGVTTSSSADPWLYNASFAVEPARNVSMYVGLVRGLEDNGAAPESAANRNEQLPATETEQIDGGVRLRIGRGSLVASVFQITKPYFSFNALNTFTEVGDVRNRGLELSYSGAVTDRLHVVAGAVLIDAEVSGDGVANGLIGDRPVGTPSAYFRLDAQYRTDIWGGLTPTLSLVHTSERAGSAGLSGGEQFMLPSRTTLDLGVRYAFEIGGVPMSLRATAANIFDEAGWRVVASNTYQMDERRRFNLRLTADF